MSTTFCEKSASESIQHTMTSKEKEGLTAKDFYEVSDACSLQSCILVAHPIGVPITDYYLFSFTEVKKDLRF